MTDRSPENVLYIIGGGLTQATAARCGKAADKFGLSSICHDVLREVGEEFNTDCDTGEVETAVINHLLEQCASHAPNLEELIEHLSLSGTSAHDKLATVLGAHFFEVLRQRMSDLSQGATENLAEILLEYHHKSKSNTNCVGILTTNYDSLIEDALRAAGYSPDFGFSNARLGGRADNEFPLLKLHGSINWTDSVPVAVAEPSGSEHASWIGPRRTKRAQDYPFNLIWGKARELLARTDRIRVIGASLYASDWHILHLLFQWAIPRDAEKARDKNIEIINNVKRGDKLVKDYPELPIVPLHRIPAIRRFVLDRKEGSKPDPDYEDENDEVVRCELVGYKNVAELWLQSIIEEEVEITAESQKLDNFMINTAGGA